MDWNTIFKSMNEKDVSKFAQGDLTYKDFYKSAVSNGVGPEIRRMKPIGAEKMRQRAKWACKRRGVTV